MPRLMKKLPKIDCSLLRDLTHQELEQFVYVGVDQCDAPTKLKNLNLIDKSKKMNGEQFSRLLMYRLQNELSEVRYTIWFIGDFTGADLIPIVEDPKHELHDQVVAYFRNANDRLMRARFDRLERDKRRDLKEWENPSEIPEKSDRLTPLTSTEQYEVLLFCTLENDAKVQGNTLISRSMLDADYTRGGLTTTHLLTSADVTIDRVLDASRQHPKIALIHGCGHGVTWEILNGRQPILSISDSVSMKVTEIVSSRFIHLLSCETATELGPDLIAKGATAFFGYVNIITKTGGTQAILSEHDHLLDRALVNGLTVEQSVQEFSNRLVDAINVLRRTGTSDEIAEFCGFHDNFRWDALDPTARLRPAGQQLALLPETSGPEPSPPC